MKKETTRQLKSLARKVERIREQEATAWAQLRNAMRDAYEDAKVEEEKALVEGKAFDPTHRATYIEIGKAVGLTKARVYQLISGKRSGRKTPLSSGDDWRPEYRAAAEAALAAPNDEVDGLSQILDSVESSEQDPESLTESGESDDDEQWLMEATATLLADESESESV